jgi:hypothetical protein
VAVIVTDSPSQMIELLATTVIVGFGLTCTVTVANPEQVPSEAVTV